MTPLEAMKIALASELNVDDDSAAQRVLDELEAQGFVLRLVETVRVLPERTVESNKVTVSLVAQLEPMGRYQNPDGDPLVSTTLQDYTNNLTRYFAENLEKFADARGGDVFLHVVVHRGKDAQGNTYRSGHYVKDEVTNEDEDQPADEEPLPGVPE